ncbi:MAG: hypothetical protein E7266_00495 [Lachnospiraceae bacterium]|nr:hypothetical protein [Lachnospiraceae bacterium]
MSDAEIINMYSKNKDMAGDMLMTKYGAFCREEIQKYVKGEDEISRCMKHVRTAARLTLTSYHPASLKLFLVRVVRDIAYKRYVKTRVFETYGTELDLTVDELKDGFIVNKEKDLSDIAMLEDAGEIVNRFLRRHPSAYRDVFIRRYFFAESVDDIATRYKSKPDIIRGMLEYSKSELKEAMRKGGF